MTLWQEFRQPTSISEAIEDLQQAPKPAVPIAGGTDLLLDIRQGRHTKPQTLIDLTCVPEMTLIETRGDDIFIGAAVPINKLTAHPLIQNNAMALIEACSLIAGPQVRNTATLGGNVAHALPAADGTIAFVALDAQAEIANNEGLRKVPFVDLFLGPGKSSIDKTCELIVGFYFHSQTPHQASAFKRIMRPQGVALPILNCAVWVERDEAQIVDVRIAVGPGGPTPFRATQAEAVLRGKVYGEALISEALDQLVSQAKFRTSRHRATEAYRKHIVSDLFMDTFDEAWNRTGG
jgi:xanthine dehydrogenase FAD-binding subunit